MGKHLDEVKLKYGMTTQDKVDKANAKEDKRKAYKGKDLSKLSKAELIAIINELTK